MFNIVMVADRNYVKYAAVLMTSIVHSTNKAKSFKDFFSENLPCMLNLNLKDIENNGGGGGNR